MHNLNVDSLHYDAKNKKASVFGCLFAFLGEGAKGKGRGAKGRGRKAKHRALVSGGRSDNEKERRPG